jgi:putative flippase GtrA
MPQQDMTDPLFKPAVFEKYRRIFSGRITRFACVGLIVALFFAGLNALFGRVFGLGPQLSFFIAYPPALAVHFLLNKLWTFGDRSTTTHLQLGEYLFSVLVTFLIQWPSFLFFQRAMGLPGWVAAFGANLIQMSVSFALLRWRVFNGAAEGGGRRLSNPWHRIAILAILLGGLSLVYWTAMGSWQAPHLRKVEDDYYNLLVDGFRKGSLALDVPVPEALKNAENPWDPAKRPAAIELHDASYFNGHYYLYFGVVPAALLFWPFHALTGFDLPFVLAAVFYICGAFLVSAWLWLRVLRERFPQASLLSKLAGPIVLGLCAGQLSLARRASIWEMPIAAGHFFMVGLVASAYLALRSRRPWAALAAAGLSLGLAIGCRPTLAAAGPALAFLVITVGWTGAHWRARWFRLTKSLCAAGIPFAAVVSGLLAYNWRRFGNPMEFGLNYQLSAVYEAKAHHFLLRFAPFNLDAYFLRAPQWGRYFPFLHPISWVTPPDGYYGMEFVYGAIVVCPVLWWSPFSLGILTRRRDTVEASLVMFLLAMAVGTTLLLACFNTAAARYIPDFLPWWLWLALLGWAWFECHLAERQRPRRVVARALQTVFASCAAASFFLSFVQSAALHGILANRNPDAFRQISRVFDLPAAAWERINRERSGPLTMDVSFPEFRSAALEPLLVTGVEYEADYFFVYYKAPGIVRLGFANSGDAPIYSGDISVRPGTKYRVRFEGGSLYPPDGHPVYLGWSSRQVHAAKTWVRIGVDGRLVVNQPTQFHEGAPESLQVGVNDRGAAFGQRFAGVISNVQREPLTAPPELAAFKGDVVLEVTLPDEIVPASQPLVVAGKTGSAELVGYRSIDDKHFVLTYEKWGGGYWESDPILIPAKREATFRVRLGSLLPESGPYPQGLYKDLLIVWMDGQPVWWRHAFGAIGADPPVEVMANTIGSSAMRGSFQGNLLSLSREPVPDWEPRAFQSLELDLVGRGSGVQPLAVTGVSGRADLLAIEWLPRKRARLLLDHWSHPGFSSPDFDWGPDRMHHLKLTLPSFAALDDPSISSGTGRLRAEVDGVLIWKETVPFYGAGSATFAFGKNTVGSSIAVPVLDCRLGDIRQDFGMK